MNEVIDNFGNTLLHEAVRHNDVEMIKLLLSHNASIDVKNKFGETPKSLAVEYDSDLMLYVDEDLK